MSFKKQNPSDFLKLIIGKPVVVKLNSGVDYRGKLLEREQDLWGALYIEFGFAAGVLACLDGYMNIALEQTEEYVNGQVWG